MANLDKCGDPECICHDDSIELRCPDPECVCNHQPAWVPPGFTSKGGAFTRKGHPEFYAAFLERSRPTHNKFELPDWKDHTVFSRKKEQGSG